MKSLIMSFLLLLALQAAATDYYLSSSTGNDVTGNGTQAAPWASIAKINTITLAAGDRVFFKRGDTFYGSITVTGSGTSSSPITYAAYGTGAAPIITGLTTLSQNNGDWTTVATNIYEITVPGGLAAAMNIVLLNGAIQPMGRYPNYTTFGGSFARFEGHEGDSVITDVQLPATPSYIGGQLCVKSTDYTIDSATILTFAYVNSSTGTRIGVDGAKVNAPSNNLSNNWGYFIQNHPATLDVHGEWYYNISTKKFRIYLNNSPGIYTIKVPTVDRGISLSGRNYIVVDGLHFEGYNTDIAWITSASTNNTFQNCTFRYAKSAVWHGDGNSHTLTFDNCIATDITQVAFYCRNNANTTVRNSIVKRIALWPGLGMFGQGAMGVWSIKDGGTYTNNRFDSIGYIALRLNGSNLLVQNNVVMNFCMMLGDGGGIYVGNTDATFVNRKILNNVVVYGWGNVMGTNQETSSNPTYKVYAIYTDDFVNGMEIAYNTVGYSRDAAIMLHNNRNVNVHHNTFFGGGRQVVFFSQNYASTMNDVARYSMHEIVFKHNTIVARSANELVMKIWSKPADSTYITTMDEAYGAARTDNFLNGVDSNVYARPINQDSITVSVIWGVSTTSAQARNYKNSQWTAAFGHDRNTTATPKKFSSSANPDTALFFFWNPKLTDSVMTLQRTWMDVSTGDVYYTGQQYRIAPLSGGVFLAHTATSPPNPPLGQYTLGGFYIYTNATRNKAYRWNNKIWYKPITYPKRNQFLYSEEVDRAEWTKVEVTIAPDQTTAPDGTVTAESVTEAGGTTGNKQLKQVADSVKVDSFYTFSAYVKDGDGLNGTSSRRYVQLSFSSTGGSFNSTMYANFDLINDAVTLQGSGLKSAHITALPNGWKRIAITAKAIGSSTTSTPLFLWIPSATSARLASYTGTAGRGGYVWGLQFHVGDVLLPYTKTTSTRLY